MGHRKARTCSPTSRNLLICSLFEVYSSSTNSECPSLESKTICLDPSSLLSTCCTWPRLRRLGTMWRSVCLCCSLQFGNKIKLMHSNETSSLIGFLTQRSIWNELCAVKYTWSSGWHFKKAQTASPSVQLLPAKPAAYPVFETSFFEVVKPRKKVVLDAGSQVWSAWSLTKTYL